MPVPERESSARSSSSVSVSAASATYEQPQILLESGWFRPFDRNGLCRRHQRSPIRTRRVDPSVPPCTVFERCDYFSGLDVRLRWIDEHQRDCCAGVSLHRAAASGHRAPRSSLAACDSLATMTTGSHSRGVGEPERSVTSHTMKPFYRYARLSEPCPCGSADRYRDCCFRTDFIGFVTALILVMAIIVVPTGSWMPRVIGAIFGVGLLFSLFQCLRRWIAKRRRRR